jgi:lantibiotic modifying enzyme
MPSSAPLTSAELGHAALAWLESTAIVDGDGLRWGSTPTSPAPDPDLYHGSAGVVLALAEGQQHFADDRWGDLAVRGARSLAASVGGDLHPSLYFGLAGIAWTLTEIAARFADAAAGRAAARAMDGVRAAFDGDRFGDMVELMGGNAGIALAALRCGDVGFAEAAVEPYLRTAETTAHGVTWEQRRGLAARRHHLSHGTLGIAYGLAAVAHTVGRDDLLDLALAATADVVARNESTDGFLVPHSDPQQQAPGLERYSYGWCHGPAGDAQLFRLLGQVTGDPRWAELVDRCWHTVVTSGVPRRLRPGFWDNVGRCCGTGGVLALALDRAVGDEDARSFADLLVEDLAGLAVVDGSGARWSNLEHRRDPPELEPRAGWAWGNAGLVPELLRHARIGSGRNPAYAIPWPDHPA